MPENDRTAISATIDRPPAFGANYALLAVSALLLVAYTNQSLTGRSTCSTHLPNASRCMYVDLAPLAVAAESSDTACAGHPPLISVPPPLTDALLLQAYSSC